MNDRKLSGYLKTLVSSGGLKCLVHMVTDIRETPRTTGDMLGTCVIRFPKLYVDHFPILSAADLIRFCQSMTSLVFGIVDVVVVRCEGILIDLLQEIVRQAAEYFQRVATRKLDILQNKLPRELCAEILNQIIVDEWQDHCTSFHRWVIDSWRIIPGPRLSMQQYFMMSKPAILL